MLTEAGLLVGGQIVYASLSEPVRQVLRARTPSDMRFLPTRDDKEDAL